MAFTAAFAQFPSPFSSSSSRPPLQVRGKPWLSGVGGNGGLSLRRRSWLPPLQWRPQEEAVTQSASSSPQPFWGLPLLAGRHRQLLERLPLNGRNLRGTLPRGARVED